MRKKVCLLTSVHPPFDVRIFHKEAKSLSMAGYDVTLIAQHDSEEIVDGIKVINLQRSRNRIERIIKAIFSVFRIALKIDADIYHFHDPELIPVGMMLRITGKRVIYDVHEDLPAQILSKVWLHKNFRKIISLLIKYIEAFAAKHFSAIITASTIISNRFIKFNSETVTIRNYPILSETPVALQADFNKYIKIKDPFSKTIISLGGINSNRCVKEIVEAVGLLSSGLGIKLIVAGACISTALFEEIQSLSGWTKTEYFGQLPRLEAMTLLKSSNIALIIYSPAPNHYEVRSNRLFESMAAGIPVITSNFPEWKEIVEGVGCGVCVDPLNPSEISKAIMWLIEHPTEAEAMGTRGRQAVEQLYNWDIESIKLISLYKKLLTR